MAGKEITGDVSVGRHATVGGNLIVQGREVVKGGLRVEGWLDAPNVKGAAKGLFMNEAQLKEVYPRPEEGWWALVGNTLPAEVYMSDGGEWKDTGNKAGVGTVDTSGILDFLEAEGDRLEDALEEERKNRQEFEQTMQGNLQAEAGQRRSEDQKIGEEAAAAKTAAEGAVGAVGKLKTDVSVYPFAGFINNQDAKLGGGVIVFSREDGKFVQDSGGNWHDASADYNINGHARYDCIFRQANTLYRAVEKDFGHVNGGVKWTLAALVDGEQLATLSARVTMTEDALKEWSKGAATMPFEGEEWSVDERVIDRYDDGAVVFDKSSGVFYQKAGGAWMQLGEYNTGMPRAQARKDMVFRNGGRLYHVTDGGSGVVKLTAYADIDEFNELEKRIRKLEG